MTIKRQNVGDIDFTLAVYRDGKKLQTGSGNWDLREYIAGFEIYESIQSATIEAMMIVSDAGGLIGAFTGTEKFELRIKGTVYDRTYWLRSYEINSRSRSSQNNEVYIVNLASDEYIKNEVVNVFGNSNKIFNDTETSAIIRTLMTNIDKIGTQKRLFLEETLNRHSFVIPNWRPFDAIYWMCHRSIRKTKSGGALQNGFAFYENALGYHFKSIDQMIEDVNDQTDKKTDVANGKPRLYTYTHAPKNVSTNAGKDQFAISKVVFPSERNFLLGLRNGTWSGYSIGFDPNTISNSKFGESTDMSVDAYRYSLTDVWKKMSHLKGGKNANPIKQMDTEVQNIVEYPKRVRYTILPNQIFDPKFKQNPQKNYEELVELQAYQWMRMEALKTIKLQIEIPGNLDLYAGSGIDIIIPAVFKSGHTTKIDQRYSGRYLIAALTHKSTGQNMVTELLLMKDSMI